MIVFVGWLGLLINLWWCFDAAGKMANKEKNGTEYFFATLAVNCWSIPACARVITGA